MLACPAGAHACSALWCMVWWVGVCGGEGCEPMLGGGCRARVCVLLACGRSCVCVRAMCMCVGRHTGAEGPGLSCVGGWHVPAGCSPLSFSLFPPELRVGTFERHMVMSMLLGDDFTLLDGS